MGHSDNCSRTGCNEGMDTQALNIPLLVSTRRDRRTFFARSHVARTLKSRMRQTSTMIASRLCGLKRKHKRGSEKKQPAARHVCVCFVQIRRWPISSGFEFNRACSFHGESRQKKPQAMGPQAVYHSLESLPTRKRKRRRHSALHL